jgi:hypothetical protein
MTDFSFILGLLHHPAEISRLVIHRHFASLFILGDSPFPGISAILDPESEDADMIPNENKSMEAYAALIASLEKENRIQGRLIEAQRAMIETLEAHNAELEKIINSLSTI